MLYPAMVIIVKNLNLFTDLIMLVVRRLKLLYAQMENKFTPRIHRKKTSKFDKNDPPSGYIYEEILDFLLVLL